MSVSLTNGREYTFDKETAVAGNSFDSSGGDRFITLTGNIASDATSTSRIAGTSVTRKAYASDNSTVAMKTLEYIAKKSDVVYDVTITGGTITVADEGKYYNLSDAVTVDGTTESTKPFYTDTTAGSDSTTAPLVSMQLKLVKFVSATNSKFSIINLG